MKIFLEIELFGWWQLANYTQINQLTNPHYVKIGEFKPCTYTVLCSAADGVLTRQTLCRP